MKKFLKGLTPPIIWDKAQYFSTYINFLSYKKLVNKNIELKNAQKGKRCFILGSAPSIMVEDLKPLQNEIVFALNNFYVHRDFAEIMRGNKPKYYLTAPVHPPQTEVEWKTWFLDMEDNVPKTATAIFGLDKYKYNINYMFNKYGLFRAHEVYWYYAGILMNSNYVFKSTHFQLNSPILAANTVSTYALIVAIYMGFDTIYLLGIDHNYICIKNESDYRFYKDSIHQKDENKRMNIKLSDELRATAEVFREKELIAKKFSAIKIYNCSKDSLLNMFEKKSFRDALLN